MIKFNSNNYVRLTLRDEGRRILAAQAYPLSEEAEKDGKVTMQMWRMMQVFGPHINMGIRPPFETTIELLNPIDRLMRDEDFMAPHLKN